MEPVARLTDIGYIAEHPGKVDTVADVNKNYSLLIKVSAVQNIYTRQEFIKEAAGRTWQRSDRAGA